MDEYDADLAYFPNEYVPNEQGTPYHSKWVNANPVEASKWAAFRDAVLALKAEENEHQPTPPALSTKHGKALVAAGKEHMSISRVVGIMRGTGANPSTPPTPPTPPPPSTGTLIWNGDLDTGNESQWTNIIRNATDRFRVTTGADGVVPRQGTHMARVECRQGEATTWQSTLSATLAIKQLAGIIGYNEPTTDMYLGWSAWVPSTWPWAANAPLGMNSIFMEIHGNGAMIQAPFHWGISPFNGKFYLDLHRDQTGWHQYTYAEFEALSAPGMANRWIDCVVRIKWSMASDGILEFWQDGVLRHTYNGATAPLSGESMKLQAGIYTGNVAPATKNIYLDEMKLGTTYAIVAPG